MFRFLRRKSSPSRTTEFRHVGNLKASRITRMRRNCMERLEDKRLLAITLSPLGTYSSGVFDESAAEIVAHDPDTQRLFVTNAFASGIDVLNMSDPTNPTLLFTIDTTSFGVAPTSVAVSSGTVAVAVRNDPGQPEGSVAFFDTDGNPLNSLQVGFGPDMLTFTPDGTKVLVANQGSPNDAYTVDPEGSVSIIDISAGVRSATVTTASLAGFNGLEDELRDQGVRIFGPVVEDGEIVGEAPAANDLEPEYIAVSDDSSTAWVSLQVNNAIAILDIATASFLDIKGLGYKNHRAHGNGLDASDKDGGINIARWRVQGMYQPDGIVAYSTGDGIRLISANEGGLRDYEGFSEEARLKDVNVTGGLQKLQANEKLGRLGITTYPPHGRRVNKDGEVVLNQLYAPGTRSFSIWTEDAELVYDSGDDFEQITAAELPEHFNANNDNGFDDGQPDNLDSRSDNKGPEPETVTVGEIDGRTYAFIGLERIGGVMVYDVTDPTAAVFQSYVNRRDFTQPNTVKVGGQEIMNADVGDLAVEGIEFIPASESPTGTALLVTANEVSGTTTIFEIVEDAVVEVATNSQAGNVDLSLAALAARSVSVDGSHVAHSKGHRSNRSPDQGLVDTELQEAAAAPVGTTLASSSLFSDFRVRRSGQTEPAGVDIALAELSEAELIANL